eukprot:m.46802 g.46802  ORF g.46802 m.46802 type:complete len:1030 (+) comp6806_c0_seq1:50-3139(+)
MDHRHLLPASGSQRTRTIPLAPSPRQHSQPRTTSESSDEGDTSPPVPSAAARGMRSSVSIPIPTRTHLGSLSGSRSGDGASMTSGPAGVSSIISLSEKDRRYHVEGYTPPSPASMGSQHRYRTSSLSMGHGRICAGTYVSRYSVESNESDSGAGPTTSPLRGRVSSRSGLSLSGPLMPNFVSPSRGPARPSTTELLDPLDEGPSINNASSTMAETAPLLGDSKHHESWDSPGSRRPRRESACARLRPALAKLIRPLIVGVINGIIVLPVMVGYAQIVFKDPFFKPYMPTLINLMVFSAAIHQLGFSVKSTLHFAIGSVQDAGLIFLSTMSSDIVRECRAHNATPEETLATVLCWLAMSTALLGLALILTGWLRLASLVQYLPLPVVGGYLAFIGLYCLEAGLGVMAGRDISSPADYGNLLHADLWILMAPGVVGGIVLLLIVQHTTHPAALPGALLGIPLLFYAVVLCGGWSMDELRSAYGVGWLAENEPQPPFYRTWDGFEFSRIQWYAIPKQLPTWFTMFIVVAFSSSLDVAAIQMELGRPLDFNAELQTVGFANVVSGLTGGYTGSYIFSQTIFTMRTGIRSRVVGIVIIPFLLLMFCLPFSLQAFVPTFFFGAVLIFIAFDLMLEWLWHARKLVARSEYAIILITFAAITASTLIIGFAVGIGCCVLHFLFLYAKANHISKQPARSTVWRGFQQRRILARYRKAIVVHRLNGYIFFGSAISILKSIRASIKVHDDDSGNNDNSGNGSGNDTKTKTLSSPSATPVAAVVPHPDDDDDEMHLTHFLLLDFEAVKGVDATAARSLFVTLVQSCENHGITLVATGLAPETHTLLRCHGVCNYASFREFETLDEGIKYCEDALLCQIEPNLHPQRLTPHDETLEGILAAYLLESSSFPKPDEVFKACGSLSAYFNLQSVKKGEILFDQEEPGESLYFISHGSFLLRRHAKYRTGHYGQGGIIGDLDFFSNAPRSFSAVAEEDSTVYALTRHDLNRLYADEPRLATMLLHVVLKSVSLNAAANRLILQRIV